MLLFFWILSKWGGGEGPAQIFVIFSFLHFWSIKESISSKMAIIWTLNWDVRDIRGTTMLEQTCQKTLHLWALLSCNFCPRSAVSLLALTRQQTKEMKMLTWHTLFQQILSPLKDIVIKPNWYYLAMRGMKFWRKDYLLSLVVWYF